MIRSTIVILILTAILALAFGASGEIPRGAADPTGTLSWDDYRLTGPYSHANLSLFLVHGPDQWQGADVLTLTEAMKRGAVTVYETDSVNELAIENVAGDVTVFILSGDIVKGGKQDRTLKHDLLLRPRSGKVPVPAHCVESGRWRSRGEESTTSFGGSTKMLTSKSAKLGNRGGSAKGGGQGAVWGAVAEAQEKYSRQLNKSVRNPDSETSLQLTLEDEDLERKIEAYTETLEKIVRDSRDVIGFAFAINGELNSADIFGSSRFFAKVWPRLLEAAATEAMGEFQAGATWPPVSLADVKELLASTAGTEARAQQVTDDLQEITHESAESILFETKQETDEDKWLRRNYLKK